MKKSILSLMYLAMAMGGTESMDFTEQGSVNTSKRKLPPPKRYTPFKEQEGIINLIKEYKLIQKGESKKGKLKQSRTVSKINEFLDKGFLTKEDIK